MASAATQFGIVSAAISMAFGTAEAVRRVIKWHRKRLRAKKKFRDIGVATDDIPAAVEEELSIECSTWDEDSLESCWYRGGGDSSTSSFSSEVETVGNSTQASSVETSSTANNAECNIIDIDSPRTRMVEIVGMKSRIWRRRKVKTG